MSETIQPGTAEHYLFACTQFRLAQRAQRAAYFAWQDEPIGQTAARTTYVIACAEMRRWEATVRVTGYAHDVAKSRK